MKEPLISVVIPAYNAEKWLPATVGSVLDQSYANLELIIVNDGSTDKTGELADSINDRRVRVIHKANGGVCNARNAGMAMTKGDFIAFMDADDIMWRENLEIKIRTLLYHGVDWVFSDLQRCNTEMQPFGAPDRGTDGNVVDAILGGREIAVPCLSSNVLMSRKCYDNGCRFDPSLSNAGDQDMALSLASKYTYKHIPKVLFGYRNVPGSMSKNITLYQKDHLYLFEKATKNGLFKNEKFKRYCFANAYWAIGGSWWKNARKPLKAIPFFLKALVLRPALISRPYTRA